MQPSTKRPWSEARPLTCELEDLHSEMLNLVNENLPAIEEIHRENRTSVTSLLHYLALRRHDIRGLREQLAALGLSSLGRTEAHVLSAVRAKLFVRAD